MNWSTAVRWSWVRGCPAPGQPFQPVLDELRDFRDVSTRGEQRPWALSVRAGELVVHSSDPGPAGWPACLAEGPEPLLPARSPAEVLLQSVAADLFVLVASQPPADWSRALDAVANWPHARRWRGRGSGRHQRRGADLPLSPSVAVAEFERGVETAWSVVSITADALGAALVGFDRSSPGQPMNGPATWARVAERLHEQFALVSGSSMLAEPTSQN